MSENDKRNKIISLVNEYARAYHKYMTPEEDALAEEHLVNLSSTLLELLEEVFPTEVDEVSK